VSVSLPLALSTLLVLPSPYPHPHDRGFTRYRLASRNENFVSISYIAVLFLGGITRYILALYAPPVFHD